MALAGLSVLFIPEPSINLFYSDILEELMEESLVSTLRAEIIPLY
jgi:hypothetical protein